MAGTRVSTNRKTRFSWSRAKVDVLRLDHYFFNKNSAVILPVKLPDSDKPDKISAAALDALGIKSLAAVLDHCRKDDALRVVIAGHADATDDSGGIPERFALSEMRAKAVYALVAGRPTNWVAAVTASHGVLDWKTILKYVHLNKALYFGKAASKVGVIDPGALDDAWNDAAEKATRNLIIGFNAYAKTREGVTPVKLSGAIKKIKADDARRWPEELWKAVFVLMDNGIARTLGLKTKSELRTIREKQLKFSDNDRPFLGCGESVPLKGLDDQKKSSYEPEPGRGAEVVFFRKKDIPGKKVSKVMRIVCPAKTDAKHVAKECPIFYKHHLKATYIDHRDLDLDIYHLKFVYYDRVLGEITPVPKGLELEAACWDETAAAKAVIDTVTDHNDGVYSLKVPRVRKGETPRKNISFWFKTGDPAVAGSRAWVFTENADSKPKLVVKTDAEVAALAPAERVKYYDLPTEWCSLNYRARFEKYATGDVCGRMMKKKGFKPYGSKDMASSKPLIFSLDDIVLTKDADGRQNVTDQDDSGNPQPLSKDSRVTLLYADAADGFKIKIHKAKEKEPYFSDVAGGFEKNLIHDYWTDGSDDPHSPCRAVLFCGDFYDIYRRRTLRNPDFRFNRGHILGARAAMKSDATCSGTKSFSGWDAGDKASGYVCDGAGNYRLHYLHDWGFSGGKTYSGLVIYWSCRFSVDTAKGGKNADKAKYIEEGMKNAMDRNGVKDYSLEKETGTAEVVIKTFPLYEAKQDYKSGSTVIKRGGRHICLVSLTDDSQTSSMGFDTAQFRSSAYDDEPTRFPEFNNVPDYDGRTYNCLTCAHEIGHASGLDDEYLYSSLFGSGFPRYKQYYPGMPYSANALSLMNKNRGPRMYHYWLYANWVNDAGENGQPLHAFLDGSKFRLALRGDGFDDLEFKLIGANYRNIYKPRFDDDVTYAAGGAGGRLSLYKLGGGEFASTLKENEKYDGIIVIRINMRLYFDNDTTNWTNETIIQWVQALDSDLKLMFKSDPADRHCKYFLQCGDDTNDFAKVYMYFRPFYYKPGTDNDADTHYRITVKKNGGNGFNPDAVDRKKIEVEDGVENKKIIRHLFGRFAGETDLTKAELAPIKDWIGHGTRCDAAFTIEDA